MVFEFKFPDIGEGIVEGEIVKWLIKEGEFVKEDQLIVEIQTDKAVAEIPSPKTGTIIKINFKNGETVKVGQTLVTIQEKNEKITKEERKTTSVVGQLEEALEEKQKRILKTQVQKKENVKDKILATPKVRNLARKLNVDINLVKGTGKNRIILDDDVINFSKGNIQNKTETNKQAIKLVKKYDFYGYIKRIPLKGVRKVIAENMSKSYSKAVHVTHMDFADITNLSEIREREKPRLEKKGIKLTYLSFVIKAAVLALKEHPYLNATLDEETNEIILKKYYNIGIAVDTNEGLLVPVIKVADSKNITNIAKEIVNLSKSAKERKIDLSDLKGSTFTITNVGSIGGVYATPIINYPESAILALGRIQETPLVINKKIEIRKIMPFSLTFDHRILDGAEAAKFANKIKQILENPDSLKIE